VTILVYATLIFGEFAASSKVLLMLLRAVAAPEAKQVPVLVVAGTDEAQPPDGPPGVGTLDELVGGHRRESGPLAWNLLVEVGEPGGVGRVEAGHAVRPGASRWRAGTLKPA
jgi:hypothetical protein